MNINLKVTLLVVLTFLSSPLSADPIFKADEGRTLSETITSWAKIDGISVIWNVERKGNKIDWVIKAPLVISGDTKFAISKLLESYTDVPFVWRFYKNNVLFVELGAE